MERRAVEQDKMGRSESFAVRVFASKKGVAETPYAAGLFVVRVILEAGADAHRNSGIAGRTLDRRVVVRSCQIVQKYRLLYSEPFGRRVVHITSARLPALEIVRAATAQTGIDLGHQVWIPPGHISPNVLVQPAELMPSEPDPPEPRILTQSIDDIGLTVNNVLAHTGTRPPPVVVSQHFLLDVVTNIAIMVSLIHYPCAHYHILLP